MIKHRIKMYTSFFIALFSLQSFADENTIQITVSTSEKTAAAIGYSVEGKGSGCMGRSYSGKGPKNKQYRFGYRKNSVRGDDILCGVLTLNKDSLITLVTKGDKCSIILTQ